MKFDAMTSDTHWFHENIIKYTFRPYYYLQEMNEGLIYNWNTKITKDMDVLHLGDFSLRSSIVPEILSRLNFKSITLAVGNHDRCWDAIVHPNKINQLKWKQQYIDWGFKDVVLDGHASIGKYIVYFSHLPFRGSGDHTPTERYSNLRPEDNGLIHIHGDIHSSRDKRVRKTKKGTLELDLGVDGNMMMPYLVEEVEELIKCSI